MWVYLLTNTVNGKKYVGQTRKAKLEMRLCGHKNAHKREGGCRLLNNAIRKHGWGAFSATVLARCSSLAELDAVEAAMIQTHQALFPIGYNILHGPAYAPGANPMVMAKRAATMQHPEPRARIAEGVRSARANRSEEAKAEWIENVRLAQTTPEFLALRAKNQTQVRARKSPEELEAWNRRAAKGMQDRAAKQREEKLKGMTEEEGQRWLAKLEATRKWRSKHKKVKGANGWVYGPASSISPPSAACTSTGGAELPSDDEGWEL